MNMGYNSAKLYSNNVVAIANKLVLTWEKNVKCIFHPILGFFSHLYANWGFNLEEIYVTDSKKTNNWS